MPGLPVFSRWRVFDFERDTIKFFATSNNGVEPVAPITLDRGLGTILTASSVEAAIFVTPGRAEIAVIG